MPPPHTRLYALDATRGFAVVAMVIAHTAPGIRSIAPSPVRYAEGVLNDLAAPLFALVIGVTIALTSQAAATTARGRTRYRLETAIKALVLIGLGLLLGLQFSGVIIVLEYLGFALLVALPLLFLSTRTCLILAAAIFAVSPLLVEGARRIVAANPTLLAQPSSPLTLVVDWIALGPSYRLVGILPLYLLGIGLGRVLLGRRHLPIRLMLIASIAGFVAMTAWSFFTSPETPLVDVVRPGIRGSYYEVIRDASMAVGAFTVIYWLTDLSPKRIQRTARRLLSPIAVQGTMALSIYVLHVVLLMGIYNGWLLAPATVQQTWLTGNARGLIIQIGLVLICWLFAAAWWKWLGAGPIERLLGVVTARHRPSSLWATRFNQPGRTRQPSNA